MTYLYMYNIYMVVSAYIWAKIRDLDEARFYIPEDGNLDLRAILAAKKSKFSWVWSPGVFWKSGWIFSKNNRKTFPKIIMWLIFHVIFFFEESGEGSNCAPEANCMEMRILTYTFISAFIHFGDLKSWAGPPWIPEQKWDGETYFSWKSTDLAEARFYTPEVGNLALRVLLAPKKVKHFVAYGRQDFSPLWIESISENSKNSGVFYAQI